MGDDEETHLHVTYASHFDMDEAFCARVRMAIAAGLETAPIGVVTAPGTKNPKYVFNKATGSFLPGHGPLDPPAPPHVAAQSQRV
jgi:hypothetical protein